MDSWLKNTNFIRRSQPQLSGINQHQHIPLPSSNSLDLNRHYRSASTSELYSQADTASIGSNQPTTRQQQLRYRSAQKPQIIQQASVPVVGSRMSANNLEPPPLYSSINAARSSSTVPFNVIPSYSTSAVPRPSSPQKSLSTVRVLYQLLSYSTFLVKFSCFRP